MRIIIPELALVVLIGPSGAGKSTFARTHFKPTEVLSSDHGRALVSDDENNEAVTKEAFEVLHFIAARRLAHGKLTVVDATNVQPEFRKPLAALAREYHCIPVAIVLDMPESLCLDRHRQRADREFGPHVIRRQRAEMRRSLRGLEREGFRHIYTLRSAEEVAAETGPFDIIGDVHGCGEELRALLAKLGYRLEGEGAHHPDGRKAVFLGDLVDRGPDLPGVLRLVTLCVPGPIGPGHGAIGALAGAEHRLGGPGLRADALVGQSAGAAAAAECGRGGRQPCSPGRCR